MNYIVIYAAAISFSRPIEQTTAGIIFESKKQALIAMAYPPNGYTSNGAMLFEAKEIKTKPVYEKVKYERDELKSFEEEK